MRRPTPAATVIASLAAAAAAHLTSCCCCPPHQLLLLPGRYGEWYNSQGIVTPMLDYAGKRTPFPLYKSVTMSESPSHNGKV